MTNPPYKASALVALAVLVGYLVSLAPTVTFWDAGEFIAAMKTLGIPHPPGTPLFILMGNVWAKLIPFGEYAWRTNLMSATFSAAAAGFWFLSIHHLLGRVLDPNDSRTNFFRIAGGAAAAVMSAFNFTNWQNSNETEVYSVATFIIAASVWLCLRWRATRSDPHSPRLLLLVVYLLSLSIANHLLALLAGPAVVGFLMWETRNAGPADPIERRREWARVFMMGALWFLLLGVGLGNTTIAVFGLSLSLICLANAVRVGVADFGFATLLMAVIGVSPYLFLYLRAAQNPIINEADPSTWETLLAVIRRDQYPRRSPFDDPTVMSGEGNPGRSLLIMGLQLANYLQYFDWQWARSIAGDVVGLTARFPITLLFAWLGFKGMMAHRRADRGSWWLLMLLWLATGLGLMAYMNFKPGYSIGHEYFKRFTEHEVRERDYFFVASFVVWSCWAAIGLIQLAKSLLKENESIRRRPAAALVLGLALLPMVLNFKEAERRFRPDARLAADFAYNLLNSVEPYGVIFTFGDNDTFPLWWAQEAERIRPDVRVVCLALARTPWYIRQLRDNPDREVNPETLAPYWRNHQRPKPNWPLHTMSNDDIDQAVPQRLARSIDLAFGPYRTRLDSGDVVFTEDILAIRVIQQNFGRRAIAWGLASEGRYYGLDPLLIQRGVAIQLDTAVIDTTDATIDFNQPFGAPLDVVATQKLMLENYRYADLLKRPTKQLESTARQISQTLGIPFTQLASWAGQRGDIRAATRFLEEAIKLDPRPDLVEALERIRQSASGQDSSAPKPN